MKITKEEKFILNLVITFIIGMMFVEYGHYIQSKTIESAHLVSVNSNTHSSYVISFDGEEHNYTGDWKEEYKAD